MQRLMQSINEGISDRQKELDRFWSLLQDFNLRNLQRSFDFFFEHDSLHEHEKDKFFPMVKAGIRNSWWEIEAYDRFLHKQDSPFSVHELYTWLDRAGLHMVHQSNP